MKKFLKRVKSGVFLSAVVFVLLSLVSFNLIHKIGMAQTDSSKEYIKEVAVQYRNSFTKQIGGDMKTLSMLASVIADEEDEPVEVLRRVRRRSSSDPYLRMAFVAPNGKADMVDREGEIYRNVDLSDMEFIQRALQGEAAVSPVIPEYFGSSYINCYAVPVYRDGQLLGAVTATIRTEVFREIVSEEIFSGEAVAHIVDSQGNIVFRSSNSQADMAVDNVWTDDAVALRSREKILKNVQEGRDGIYEVSMHDIEAWGAYVNTGINDWYVLTIVPKRVLYSSFHNLTRVASVSVGMIVLAAVSLVTTIILTNYRSRKSVTSLAYYDQLTGLYNKVGFLIDAKEKLNVRHDYALALFDVADFKFYNELFGYEEGDRLLKEMARILKDSLLPGECCYRDNGDCFGVLVFIQDPIRLKERLYHVCSRISQIAQKENKAFKITIGCGVKIIEMYSNKIDFDIFMDRASMALQQAKGGHSNKVNFYNDEIHARARMRNMIENRMHPALENREFQVYIQPKISLSDGALAGGEALIRWPIEDGKMIYPGDFIPVFEKNGFVAQVDLYMLEAVCRLLRSWLDAGYQVKPISVNQSKVLFYQKNYIEKVTGITEKYQIPPSLIVLEVTESLMMESAEEINQIFQHLESRGFHISLDDFGAGYSSLNTLKDLSIDELKIDRIFLSRTEEEWKSKAVLKCMFDLAKSLSIRTVVEGVETREQLETIRELGGDVIQGYYYDRPLTARTFQEKYL